MRQVSIAFGIATILLVSLVYYGLYNHQEMMVIASRHVVAPKIEASQPKRSVKLHSGKPVVAGGIYNLPQLAAAMSNPEIAENFKNINMMQMHPIVLDHNQLAWVSYWIPGNGIFWTVSPVLLHKGEVVLFDGSSYLRAQCGNRIAFAPGLRVAPELEAVSDTLEMPISSVYTINQIYPPVTPLTPYYPPVPPIYTPFPTPLITSTAANPFPTISVGFGILVLVLLLRKILRLVK